VSPTRVAATLALVAALASSACDKGSRADQFCAKLQKDHAQLSVVPSDPRQLSAYVNRYRQLAKVVPLAIDDEWHTVTDLMQSVASDDLSDPGAADKLRDKAAAAMKAVDAVRTYAQQTCGVDLALGSTTAPPTATTVVPGAPATPTAPTTTRAPTPATLPPKAP